MVEETQQQFLHSILVPEQLRSSVHNVGHFQDTRVHVCISDTTLIKVLYRVVRKATHACRL